MSKKALQSKKFIAFILSLFIIAGILIMALITQTFTLVMGAFMCIGIIGICTIAISYVTNQAALDKFIESVKGMDIRKE